MAGNDQNILASVEETEYNEERKRKKMETKNQYFRKEGNHEKYDEKQKNHDRRFVDMHDNDDVIYFCLWFCG